MDIIQSCLALAPVPYLAPAFSIFKVIWESIGQVQASNEQLQTLSCNVAQLLSAINGEYRRGALIYEGTSQQLEELRGFVTFLINILINNRVYLPKITARDLTIRREAIICQLYKTVVHKG
jgi:hypothetical protein